MFTLRRRWHVISVEVHPWPRCSDSRRFISKHWLRWFAKQAKAAYDEHEAERIAPTLPAGYVRTEYRIERTYS